MLGGQHEVVLASNIGDRIPEVIVAVALLVVAVALLILVQSRRLKSVSFDVGSIKTKFEAVEAEVKTVKETAKQTAETAAKTAETIDRVEFAVNNVPKGTPPMVTQVAMLRTDVDALRRLFDELADRMGQVERSSLWKMNMIGKIGGVLGVEMDPLPSREPRLPNPGGS